MVLAQKAQDSGHGTFRLTDSGPQLARAFGGAGKQLTESVDERGDSFRERVPRPLEAAGLDDSRGRVWTFH